MCQGLSPSRMNVLSLLLSIFCALPVFATMHCSLRKGPNGQRQILLIGTPDSGYATVDPAKLMTECVPYEKGQICRALPGQFDKSIAQLQWFDWETAERIFHDDMMGYNLQALEEAFQKLDL